MRFHDRPEAARISRRAARRRRWRTIALVLTIVFAGFCAATARLFIWPAQGAPARVSAIIVLGDQGNRLGKGLVRQPPFAS